MPLSVADRAFVNELVAAFAEHADPEKGAYMRAYMRDQFTYFGMQSPERRAAQKPIEKKHAPLDDPFAVAAELFTRKQRELHYAACDVLRDFMKRKRRPEIDYDHAFKTTVDLIQTISWWDTVDILAPSVAYPIIMESPKLELREVCREWIEDDDFWLQRSAIICQLKAKENTDVELLFELILRRADNQEFFVRKGAGWALRELSKSQPERVRAFIDKYQDRLSPLTIKEGGKYC